MRTRTVRHLHECDVCGEDAYYDCQTTQGSWANLCENHFREMGLSGGATKFKLSKNPPEKKNICLEEAVFDSTFEWGCPSCGDVHPAVEPNAYYYVVCQNCGQKY